MAEYSSSAMSISVLIGLRCCLFSLSKFRDSVQSNQCSPLLRQSRKRLTDSLDPSVTSYTTSVQFSGLMKTQNSEEIMLMAAALNQGIILQDETNVRVPHPPRSPVAHPIWTPQLFQAREPTTFELMGMIGGL